MKIGNILNNDRVNALNCSPNAYVLRQIKPQDVTSQTQKVVFSEPYENAGHYYNKSQFAKPAPPEPPQVEHRSTNNMNFDIKSLLPMLMSGKMDMLKPLLSMLGGGNNAVGSMDFAKIFELFKPKSKPKKDEKKETKQEEESSKFDDMIIIED